MLVAAGVGVHQLTVIDLDVMEPHNFVGMSGILSECVGEKKAVALSRGLIAFCPDEAMTHDFLGWRSKQPAADLIVTSVDRNTARLAAQRARWHRQFTSTSALASREA